MHLEEWRKWWDRSGRDALGHLLRKHWDVARDNPEVMADDFLLDMAKRLRTGATAVELRSLLSEARREAQGDRIGRKWTTRDQRVAEKIFVWYVEATR